jgi:hypothetical protein
LEFSRRPAVLASVDDDESLAEVLVALMALQQQILSTLSHPTHSSNNCISSCSLSPQVAEDAESTARYVEREKWADREGEEDDIDAELAGHSRPGSGRPQ